MAETQRNAGTGRFVPSDMSPTWAVCGIYKIQFPDGRFYIGSSTKVRKRLLQHLSYLEIGSHRNRRLQKRWDRFGVAQPRLLLQCREEDLVLYEQLIIDTLRPTLNISLTAGRPDMTQDVKDRISKALKGRVRTAEHCRNMSLSQKGKPRKPATPEVNRRRSLTMMGKNKGKPGRQPAEWELSNLVQRMKGNSLAVGYKLSDDHKARISNAHKGNKHALGRIRPLSERAQISLKMKEVWAERRSSNAV